MYATLVVFHTLAAAVWVGGTVALVFAAVPVLRRLPTRERADAMRALGRRWKPIGWGALAVLAASGAWLAFGYWHAGDADVLFHSRPGHLLVAKAALFVALAASSLAHDFVIGPQLNRQIREGRPRTLMLPMRTVGWFTFALTITLPVLGVVLTR